MDHAPTGHGRVAASIDTDAHSSAILDRIGGELMQGGRIMRYKVADDFGGPDPAFAVCNFRHIDALAQVGQREEARDRFADVLGGRNAFGLLSEDLDAAARRLRDCPQTCSMAGIITSAMRLSRSWEGRW